MKNAFCNSTDLENEASVESFFVLRLLAHLGYDDKEIRTKESIDALKIPRGRQKQVFKPDFMIVCGKRPRWILDAKATTENVENWTHQCAGYALLVNQKYVERPVRYYVITTGLLTRVYTWDQEEAVLSLRFNDFVPGNPKFNALCKLLGAGAARAGWSENGNETNKSVSGHRLVRPSIEEVKKAFLRCHRTIWKAEKMSPQAAFVCFAKLLFVKLWEDRRIRDDATLLAKVTAGETLPHGAARFTVDWIDTQTANTPNPIDSILFRLLVGQLEQEIAGKRRKRILERTESLGMSPGTVKQVVKILEGYYLFGIDEDLNGRMFEAFLTATMRGQDLGQFFTPRSIVKLVVFLAKPLASRKRVERVLDACCGTGGFLIEALTEMRKQVYENTSLSKAEREALLNEVANEAIAGVDAGKDPPLAKIARINMYLHGDGGSRIYRTDSLHEHPTCATDEDAEVKSEVEELAEFFGSGECFDVVLSNPPFSMDYSESKEDEKKVLHGFELLTYGKAKRKSLRSSVMFIERYWRLLKPGGRLLTVIDDSILGGKANSFVRDFIREKFIIKAVISLHGDAFHRAGARVKTSIVWLVKKTQSDDVQPAVFVYETGFVGLDDVPPKTRPTEAAAARERAHQEIDDVLTAFGAFERGEKGPWLVPAGKLVDRLDAKKLRPWSVTELKKEWSKAGAEMVSLGNLVTEVQETAVLNPKSYYTFLRVTYDGQAERGERRLGSEVTYDTIKRAKAGDIVVSNINAVNKAICVVPPGLEDLLISTEFTVLRLKPEAKADPFYLWCVLRSAAVVAELLSSATGVGRNRVDWPLLEAQCVPMFPSSKQTDIGDRYRKVIELETFIVAEKSRARAAIAPLELDGEIALERLARAKPPK